jgi:hypothetical protein
MDPPFLGLFIGGWFRVASNRSHPMHQRNSAQAGNVVGNRLDFLVVQLGGDPVICWLLAREPSRKVFSCATV